MVDRQYTGIIPDEQEGAITETFGAKTPIAPQTSTSPLIKQPETIKPPEDGSGVLGAGSGTITPEPTSSPLLFSWEDKGELQAGTVYQQNVNESMGVALRNAEEIRRAGGEYQTQLALGEYVRQQSIEKAGWTGGYKLDQSRQMEYLKATINAEMYGAQELQKLGIESQLEAARLAYDLGKEQLSMQYYNDAWQRAIQESQITERWVSPEIRDLLNQWQAATLSVGTTEEGTTDRVRAERILDQITTWFLERDINPTDINTYATATFNREMADKALLDAALASIENSPSQFIARDANGNYLLDNNGRYVVLDYATINKGDVLNYLQSFDGADYNVASASFKNYLTFLGKSTINGYLSSLAKDVQPDQESFMEWLNKSNNNQVALYLRTTLGLSDTEIETYLKYVGENLVVNLVSGEKSFGYTFDLSEKPGTATGSSESSGSSGTSPAQSYPDFTAGTTYATNPQKVITDYQKYYKDYWKLPNGTALSFDKVTSEYSWLYGSNYFTSSTAVADRFAQDVRLYNDILNGTLDTTEEANLRGFDQMIAALTVIKQDGVHGATNILRDVGLQTLKNLTGIDLKPTDIEGSEFFIKATSLTAAQKTKLEQYGFVLKGSKYEMQIKPNIPAQNADDTFGNKIMYGFGQDYRWRDSIWTLIGNHKTILDAKTT